MSTDALTPGMHLIVADYSGDGTYLPSTASLNQTVKGIATTTSLSSSLNPSRLGDLVTFTATISNAAATGTVQFTIDGLNAGGAIDLVGGVATYQTNALGLGAHSISVAYSGDAIYLASSSNPITQTVGPALIPTSVALTSSGSPSAYLGNVTFTAVVSRTNGGAAPNGRVQFNIDGVDVGQPVTLSGAGRAAYNTATLAAGAHNVVATYLGNNVYAGSASAPLAQVVNPLATSVSVTASRNPAVYTRPITFTAQLNPGTAVGTVDFTIDGVPYGAPVNLVNGRAAITVNNLAVGSHSVVANFGGSANYLPSSSAPRNVTINPANSRTTVTSSAARPPFGTPVVFTATVTPNGGGATGVPAGTVQFFVDGVAVGGPVALNAAGQATYVTSSLSRGRHTIRAVYTGDFRSSNGSRTVRVV
jgi:hypothetical protein